MIVRVTPTRRQHGGLHDVNFDLTSGYGDQLVQEEQNAWPKEEVVEEWWLVKEKCEV